MVKTALNINSIAVITGRDLVGDALIKLPFARALRAAWPKAKIHWVTSQNATAYASILREPTRHLIDEIHETPPWLATTQKEATEKTPPFDLILDTRNRWKDALIARKIPHKVFIAMAARHLMSDRRPKFLSRKPAHLCDRLLQMVELAAGYLPPSKGSLDVPDELLAIAKQILPQGHTYIGISPGCSTNLRMWPTKKFIELARIEHDKGRVPVFILGPQERDQLHDFLDAVPQAKFPLQESIWQTRDMTLNHTLAVGKQLTLHVGNDSGPGHIMAAVDCPVVSLFGPTTPLKAAPRASHVHAVCAQTYGGSHMDAIPVEAVSQAIDEMLIEIRP